MGNSNPKKFLDFGHWKVEKIVCCQFSSFFDVSFHGAENNSKFFRNFIMETTSGPQTSKTQPELINLGYISSGEDEEKEYSNDPYSFAMDIPNGPSKFSMKIPSTSNDTGIGSLIRDAPTSSFSPRNWSRSSTSASNLRLVLSRGVYRVWAFSDICPILKIPNKIITFLFPSDFF